MSSISPVTGQPHDRLQVDATVSNGLPFPGEDSEGSDGFEISIGQKMLSAVTGSLLTSLLVTPLDVVRVRLQSQQPSTPPQLRPHALPNAPFSNLPPNLGVTTCCREVFWVNNNAEFCVVSSGTSVAMSDGAAAAGTAAECAAEQTQQRTITSTLDGLRKIARYEGFTTLWRGLSPTLVMAIPANVIYFSGYDWLRSSRASPLYGRVGESYAPLVAGSTARILAALAVNPIELFRTRMQAAQGNQSGSNFSATFAGVRDMVHSQGYRSLWRGLTLTLWRDVPFSAFYWWGYEASRHAITRIRLPSHSLSAEQSRNSRSQQDHVGTLVDSFAAGAISGAVASVITTPFDVGKTRQQVFRYSSDSPSSQTSTSTPPQHLLRPEERSMPRLLWHIFREEGMPGLFRGWVARVLKVAPACAIMISTYEVGKRMALEMKQRKNNEALEVSS